MDCRRAREVMFLFFDDQLEDDLLAPFRDHVDGCSSCSGKLDYTRKLLIIVRERCSCIRQHAPDHLRQRILVSFPHRGDAEVGKATEARP